MDVLEETFGGRMSSAPCLILNQKTHSYDVDPSLANGMAQIRFCPAKFEDKELGVSPYAFHATCSHPMHFLSPTRKAAVDRLKCERRDTCQLPSSQLFSFPYFELETFTICMLKWDLWFPLTYRMTPGNDRDPGRES